MPRELVILACTKCNRRNYTTTKDKRKMSARMEKVKFCPHDKARVMHKETK